MNERAPWSYPDFEVIREAPPASEPSQCFALHLDKSECKAVPTHLVRSIQAGLGAWCCDEHAQMMLKLVKGNN